MSSHYSIIRYVPDPITDERMNIGVVVVGDEGVKVKFLSEWSRARHFGDGSIAFLRRIAEQIEFQQSLGAQGAEAWTAERLRRLSAIWAGSVQFTEPSPSVRSVEALFDEVTQRFLREPAELAAADASRRNRSDARRLVVRSVRSAIRDRLGAAAIGRSLKTNSYLQGRETSCHFDLVVGNGRPALAAQALSLESEPLKVERDIHAAGWAVRDVSATAPDVRMAIVALDRLADNTDAEVAGHRDRLSRVAHSTGATVVYERDLEAWAAEAASFAHA